MCLCITAVYSLRLLQLLAPACADCNSMQGMMPGEYQVLWRTRKDALRPVGSPQSEVHMSVSCESVHSHSGSQDEQTEVVHHLSHFLMVRQAHMRPYILRVPMGIPVLCVRAI